MTPVNVPWTDINSETATVVEWHVADRSAVRAGAPLVDIETSKTALEVEAPGDGVVLQLVSAGRVIKIGEPVALIFVDQQELDVYEQTMSQAATEYPLVEDVPHATTKARERAVELGVDLTAISTSGLITVKDVERAAASAASNATDRAPASLPLPLDVNTDAQRLLIIGAGLGATQVADIIQERDTQVGVAIVDDNPSLWGREVRGLPVVGGSERIGALWQSESFDAAVIAISTSIAARTKLRKLCEAAGVPLANVIDSRAKLASGVTLGAGNVICAFCHFGTETQVGDNNFISAYNSFDHHNVLGSDISTGPGCMTSGEVHIEDRVRLGTGIFVEPKVTIGEGAIVASGAVIVRSIPAGHAVKTKVITTAVVPLRERG